MTTASVKIHDNSGKFVPARALLDSCSTVNLITERFATSLKTSKTLCDINIGAVGGLTTVASQFIKTTVTSHDNSSHFKLNFLVVPKIADFIPNSTFPRKLYNIPSRLNLADPLFHIPRSVDVLLASQTTLSSLTNGQIKLRHGDSHIILQRTAFGWVVAGGSEPLTSSSHPSCNVAKLDRLIEKFWVIEDFDHEPARSRDDVYSEEHYVANTTRDTSGRYVVRLPFRDTKFNLGSSRQQALKRLFSLERRFGKDPHLKVEYTKAMDDFITSGHMALCDNDDEDGYYLPHQPVIKESSETYKVRPVFDASSKTSTGISLNDTLIVGPTIQDSIFEQVLRFRTHKCVITADIEKMYRQILVHHLDWKYLKVLWYHDGKIRTFWLKTVTFGTACAPFLAIRTLHQLARDEAESFPRASQILLRDFYVDDLVTGTGSVEEVLSLRDEMIQLLARGGFVIRQWSSNHVAALDNIDEEIVNLHCGVKTNPIHKTLGIIWNSHLDHFGYTITDIDHQSVYTKRKLLSEISKIYDPLGLLGPVTLFAKVLIQDCWKADITWDVPLPQEISSKWRILAEQLPTLREYSLPRLIRSDSTVRNEIHGFCDACSYGYGACLYLKSIDIKGSASIQLICSKSRVAPLKGVTIPRLELCAATILMRLLVKVRKVLEFPVERVVLWSDSTIVLCWLRKAPHLLRPFESNRVAEIQSLGDEVVWRHVRSDDNPADALSRGQLPIDFSNNSLWISGPKWLRFPESIWPREPEQLTSSTLGFKSNVCLITSVEPPIYTRFSSFQRLTRVVAFILRWKTVRPTRKPSQLFSEISNSADRINRIEAEIRPLHRDELEVAERAIVALIQRERFAKEIKLLGTPQQAHQRSTSVPFRRSTSLDELNPFLDSENLIRVGGRLKKSQLIYVQRHPLLLPSKHHVTDLIIREFHEANLHAGIQSTLYSIRERYWILNGKDQIRRIVRRCVECIRQRPRCMNAQMADLPSSRVTEAPAFSKTGVDYFGPILIKEKKDRNRSFLKTYGCVFICMASKAVHIELATDLSTGGFLSAFRRFISRRGIPSTMFSDNGTNFVGADRELGEIYKLHQSPEFSSAISAFALSKRIEWNFNPPLSPHSGGLWEAAVKSFKHHLKRVLREKSLTYEQLNTLLIEIEAILNSRPLCALSADPNDPIVITPAHLLIGRPFTFLPSSDLVSVPSDRLSIFRFITKARQDFWSKWHKEYLNELQTRQKWLHPSAELTLGSVVIIMEDNLGCSRWPMGVITEVVPGSDGVVRVAMVKTANGVYKRNITRLCALPVDS